MKTNPHTAKTPRIISIDVSFIKFNKSECGSLVISALTSQPDCLGSNFLMDELQQISMLWTVPPPIVQH